MSVAHATNNENLPTFQLSNYLLRSVHERRARHQ
jgi:hypothetical protein